jgi:5-enolpyruvylshikimate-3-phosphate synthase
MSTTESTITEASLTEQIVKAHADAAVAAELAAKPPTDFEALYNAKVEENDRLQAIITSARIASSAPVNKSHKPAVTCARLRATLGDAVFHG